MKANKVITLLLILSLFSIIMELESKVSAAVEYVTDKVSIEDKTIAEEDQTSPASQLVSFFYNK